MVFLLSSSQWKARRASASDVTVHRASALQNQLGEKESWLLLLPGIAFVFCLCKLTELCTCLLNCLSVISLGLSGTQSGTDQLQAPGFLNPTNKPFPGEKMRMYVIIMEGSNEYRKLSVINQKLCDCYVF